MQSTLTENAANGLRVGSTRRNASGDGGLLTRIMPAEQAGRSRRRGSLETWDFGKSATARDAERKARSDRIMLVMRGNTGYTLNGFAKSAIRVSIIVQAHFCPRQRRTTAK